MKNEPSTTRLAAATTASSTLTFSFSAGGWLQMYHFGVAQAIKDCGFADDDGTARVKFCGTSAGALAAVALASGDEANFYDMRDFALLCAETSRRHWSNVFRMKTFLQAAIGRFASAAYDEKRSPEEKAILTERLERRAEIYATTLPRFRPITFQRFEHFDDLEEALLASCCVAPLCGLPFPLSNTGEWVCDGGIAAYQPRQGEHGVITVSPLYLTTAHIRPSTFVPLWWAISPPPRKQYLELFNVGYNDALDFFVRNRYVEPQVFTDLAKPASKPMNRAFAVVQDMAVLLIGCVLVRPAAIVVVYAEMLLLMAWHAVWLLLWMIGGALAKMTVGASSPQTRTEADDELGHASSQSFDLPDGVDGGELAKASRVRGGACPAERHAAQRTPGFAIRTMYRALRNLISLRLFLNLSLSTRIPINESRLKETSVSYGVFKPFVFPPPPPPPNRPTKRFHVSTHAAPARDVVEAINRGAVFVKPTSKE